MEEFLPLCSLAPCCPPDSRAATQGRPYETRDTEILRKRGTGVPPV